MPNAIAVALEERHKQMSLISVELLKVGIEFGLIFVKEKSYLDVFREFSLRCCAMAEASSLMANVAASESALFCERSLVRIHNRQRMRRHRYSGCFA
jgi:3-methyladenine DNA glycosylase Tag